MWVGFLDARSLEWDVCHVTLKGLFQPNQPKMNQKINAQMGFESHMGFVSFDGVHLSIPHFVFVGALRTSLPL